MTDFRIKFTGTAPLLMHNSRLSNPLDDVSRAMKKIHGKRKKTEEDHEEIARLEHAGSLYLDPDIGPYIPGQNISRALVDGAKLSRRGKDIERGVFIKTDVNPLSYRGPRDAAGLWNDKNFRDMSSAKVGVSRVMRCRPIFREWAVEADGILDPSVIDLSDLAAIAETAGQMVGLGDWRPRHGRFTATVTEI
jgi:hypothetical protein